MKVKELIEKLNTLDKGAEVFMYDWNEDYSPPANCDSVLINEIGTDNLIDCRDIPTNPYRVILDVSEWEEYHSLI